MTKFTDFLVCVVLVLVSIGSFYNSLFNDFTFDDHLALANNSDVTSENSLQLWTNDLWGKDIRAHDSHKSYRPFLIKTFRVITKSIGNQPVHFRIFSIFLHATATLLVLHLCISLTKHRYISFSAALLFASHPIHVEAVASIVNMAESIHTIFVILSYHLFTQSMQYTSRPIWRLVVSTAMWLLCVVVAVLFKETGLIGCALIFSKTVMELVLTLANFIRSACRTDMGSSGGGSGSSSRHSIWISRKGIWRTMLFMYWNAVALGTVYLYFSFRSIIMDPDRHRFMKSWHSALYQLLVNPTNPSSAGSYLAASQLIRKAENPFAALQGTEKVLSFLYLHFRYMYQLLLPLQQSPEYSFDCIPKVGALLDARNLYWLATYLTIAVLGVFGIYHAVWCSDSTATKHVTATKIEPAAISAASSETDSTSNSSATDAATNSSSSGSFSENGPEKSGCLQFKSTAILDALIWLVVPFVPASGVVFKLGTLLAERLLYMCSIGFCLLLALLLHVAVVTSVNACSAVMGVTNSQAVLHRRSKVVNVVYGVIIVSISVLYALRTVEYNTVWLNNDTLFTRSLAVCPTSAKMHMQVSKVFYGRHDYLTAREHIAIAKQIDPDFCDIGYQEALLAIAIDNDAEESLRHALGNLHCVFSNSGSMQLVTQLWQLDINNAQHGVADGTGRQIAVFKTMAKHAAQAVGAGLDLLGAKKFMEAGGVAFEAKQYKKAIALNFQAEKVVDSVEAKNRNASTSPEEVIPVPPEFKCRIYLLGGTHRAFYSDVLASHKQKVQLDKLVRREMGRTEELLFKAIEPECVVSGEMASSPQQQQQMHIALNYLSGLVAAKVNQSRVETVETYARLLTKSFHMLSLQQRQVQLQQHHHKMQLEQQKNSKASNTVGDATASEIPSSAEISETIASSPFGDIRNIRNNAASVWNTVGLKYHTGRQYEDAIASFEEALRLFSVLPGDSVHKGGASSPAALSTVSTVSTAEMKRHLPRMELTTVSCNSLYWYADALAGQDGFSQSEAQVQLVIRVLKTYMRCTDSDGDRSVSAKQAAMVPMIARLENYIRRPELQQSVGTASVEAEKKEKSEEL